VLRSGHISPAVSRPVPRRGREAGWAIHGQAEAGVRPRGGPNPLRLKTEGMTRG